MIALSRRDDRARAALAAAWEIGAEVSIPAVGEIGETGEATGRVAGALLGAASSDATVDALVVADAIERGGGVILTGDPDDLGRLAERHTEVVICDLRRRRCA